MFSDLYQEMYSDRSRQDSISDNRYTGSCKDYRLFRHNTYQNHNHTTNNPNPFARGQFNPHK